MRHFATDEMILRTKEENDWVYNGLDCCITFEVYNVIKPQLTEEQHSIYEFEMELCAPCMEMSLRGLRVDLVDREKAIKELQKDADRCQDVLNKLSMAVAGVFLNPNSHKQLKEFFYDTLQLQKQYAYNKGQRRLTTNRTALEALARYFIATPFVNCILLKRGLLKRASTLRSSVDSDKRMRASYNVGGTDTGRLSSSENVFGSGTNLQNITPSVRRIFVADPGYKIGVIDREQAESRAVGLLCWMLFGERKYLDACESGDLHTEVAKLVWPEIRNKRDAEQPFYRHWSYRDMAKRGGHGTNYYGKASTMAKHLKVQEELMDRFQRDYFGQFPEIRKYHKWCAKKLIQDRALTTPFGRLRYFFGRTWSDEVLRKGIAFLPQSFVADDLNVGLLQVWRQLSGVVQILAQIHDAIMFQYPEEKENEIVPLVLKTCEVHHNLINPYKKIDQVYPFFIPNDCKTGWNWGYYNNGQTAGVINLDGLRGFDGKDTRVRTSRIADTTEGLLDRKIS